uniref:Uncharacterized protein n=1 Tax=uncultured prokaryote TaxID=198431 RepID=A0A0H5Q3P7_9ZZZZ|nr:hypothetical protein [uncultured prokaryote]
MDEELLLHSLRRAATAQSAALAALQRGELEELARLCEVASDELRWSGDWARVVGGPWGEWSTESLQGP